MLLSLAMLWQRGELLIYQEQIAIIAVASSLLLISPIRMFALKFKGFGFKENRLRYLFLLLSVAIIICEPTYSILLIIVLYIVVSTLRWLFAKESVTEKK